MKTAEIIPHLKARLGEVILKEENFLGETTIEVSKEHLVSVLSLLKDQYEVLMDLTAVDYIEPKKRTKVVYWLHNPTNYERIRIVLFVHREEIISSVTNLWEGADWFERELYDMFGINFEGHPDLKRILMPDDWKGHPMRRDYALTEEKVAFKHGALPKVPSATINTNPSNEPVWKKRLIR